MKRAYGESVTAALCLPDEGGLDAVPLPAAQKMAGVPQAAGGGRFDDRRDGLADLALANFMAMNAAVEKLRLHGSSAVEVLKFVIQTYHESIMRFPARYRLMLSKVDIGQEGALASEMRRTLRTVARLVQTAQEAGELKDGDPDKFAALIVGATHGQADLDSSGVAQSAGKPAPSLLVDLLAQKSGGRNARHFERHVGSLRTIH